MASFTCPFCGCSTTVSPANLSETRLSFSSLNRGGPHLKIEIYRCPNEECKKETVFATGVNGYIEEKRIAVYPQAVFRHFPDYIPEAIRKDYEEACLIRELSPKAAATLARRCLQGMIHDFWQIHGSNLYDEINQLKGKISSSQWNAIQALRQMGNIGAHMEKDTNLIVDIAPGEAEILIRLIELLLEKWYVARHDEDNLYTEVTATNANLQNLRHP